MTEWAKSKAYKLQMLWPFKYLGGFDNVKFHYRINNRRSFRLRRIRDSQREREGLIWHT